MYHLGTSSGDRIKKGREHKVMLDKDLAELYGVETFNLNKAVKRNIDRFPEDFMFQLSKEEFQNLIFQNGISSWGGTRKPPNVFTEQGIAMLSSVLKSKRAVQVNIAIMRVFVEVRKYLATQSDVKAMLGEHQRLLDKHDKNIQLIFQAIQQLTKPPQKPKRQIGFVIKEPSARYTVRRKQR